MHPETDHPVSLSIAILAAGKGTRMKSTVPKVLHTLAGRPLLGHVIDTARALEPERICVVYGHGGEALPRAFEGQSDIHWALQEPQLGTGHAVQQAMGAVAGTETALILYGDVPLISATTLRDLTAAVSDDGMALLTAEPDDPSGYGRIVRDEGGRAVAIVEEKDANDAQRAIREINTGIMALPVSRLGGWLARLDSDNAQGEYYLTDILSLAVADGVAVHTMQAGSIEEIAGVNSRAQLVELERYYQQRLAADLSARGVTLRDPARFDLRGSLEVGQDIEIDANVLIEGRVRIGDNTLIEPNCVIRDSVIGAGVTVHSHSVIEQAEIGDGCTVGPFARLRPATVLDEGAKVGNFVEMKKARIGRGSKVNHLSYIGDATLGRDVNIGAGTITCNYDGANKHQTVIGDGVFIGSDTQLVAPVKIGENATIGAGSTINRDAPAGQLTLSRVKQKSVEGWQRPKKRVEKDGSREE
jgi:bifunctional UDP-N-acetylglucosamine pyrophosphorylase/glucosamine-1-phosphate N-acetyltransferase